MSLASRNHSFLYALVWCKPIYLTLILTVFRPGYFGNDRQGKGAKYPQCSLSRLVIPTEHGIMLLWDKISVKPSKDLMTSSNSFWYWSRSKFERLQGCPPPHRPGKNFLSSPLRIINGTTLILCPI